MPLENPPEWWEFELELSPHLLDRMIDRAFSEADVRLMVEVAEKIRQGSRLGRWVLGTIHLGEKWEVIGRSRSVDRGDHGIQGDVMLKRVFLKVTYRHGRPIAAYLQLPRQQGDRAATTEQIDDVLLLDRTADGRPIGIEITDPSQFDADRLIEVLQSLGQTEIDRDEFRPLAAA